MVIKHKELATSQKLGNAIIKRNYTIIEQKSVCVIIVGNNDVEGVMHFVKRGLDNLML